MSSVKSLQNWAAADAGGAEGLTARPWVQCPSPEGFGTRTHIEKVKKGKEICCQDVNLKQ